MNELLDRDLEFYGGKDVVNSARATLDRVDVAADAHRRAAQDVTALSARVSRQADEVSSRLNSLLSSGEGSSGKK
jgi:hypothetical protein